MLGTVIRNVGYSSGGLSKTNANFHNSSLSEREEKVGDRQRRSAPQVPEAAAGAQVGLVELEPIKAGEDELRAPPNVMSTEMGIVTIQL